MIAEKLFDELPVRNQRKATGHMVQRLGELGCNAAESRPGLEAYRGLRFASGLTFGFGGGGGGGFVLVLDGGFWGDFVVVPGDGLFTFWGRGCHGAHLVEK